MVQVDKLSKSFGARDIFTDATFQIGPRDRCLVAGRNGSGKSTLLKILAGIEDADSGAIYYPKGTRIGALPQHVIFTQPTLLEEAILGLSEHERDHHYKAEIILSGLGFSDDDFTKAPSSFSGGYQLRLSLCKVLVGDPDLLILDEPTNYLDILAIRWLEEFLSAWPGQIIFVSHDRSFANSICTHVIGIKRSLVKKVSGNLDTYKEAIEIMEETHERRRAKLDRQKKHMMDFVERFGAKATKAGQAQSRLKAIEKMESLEALGGEDTLDFSFTYKSIRSKRVLEAEGLRFSYHDAIPLIHDLTFEVANGERIAIVGKNGSGKSTLLRLLLGDLNPLQGAITLGVNTELAYFGQTNIDRLNNGHSIEEELMNAFPATPYPRIRAVCGAMLFPGDDAKKSISVLSGGERSRVLLAKILLTPANLLLLDEPTHHLDVESVEALLEAIALFPGTVIMVTHDEDVLKKFTPDKMVICHNGSQELFHGSYTRFLETSGWEEEH